MEKMRREKRAMALDQIKELVNREHVLRIGLFEEDFPYVVPVNYAFEWQDETLIFYIHGATEGKKVSLIKKNPKVCVEIDTSFGLIETGRKAEGYSFAYESLIGFGTAEIVEDANEKLVALDYLMQHETGKDLTSFDTIPEGMVQRTGIIKLIIPEFSGKYHEAPVKNEIN